MKNVKSLTKTQQQLIIKGVNDFYDYLISMNFFSRFKIALNIIMKKGK